MYLLPDLLPELNELNDMIGLHKFKKQIVVRNQEVSYGGYKSKGLIYKIPTELGGDGKYQKANQPGIDTGDFFAISGDLLPIITSIGAGTFGSGCQSCPLGYARSGTDQNVTQCRQCQLGETARLSEEFFVFRL